MTQLAHTLRMAATLALASLGGTSSLAADSAPPGEAREAADAAEAVAQEVESAIATIDPSLPQPYDARDDGAAVDLPELPPVEQTAVEEMAGEQTAGATGSEAVDAGRGPAVRMISQPVVQALPAPDPVTPSPAAARAAQATQAAQSAQAKADPFTIKSILTIPEGPFRYGDWYWDESAAPSSGKLVITVDLEARVISAFRDGHEIGTAVALLGTKKHPTPLGTFPILTKEKDNISEKYNNAPMPWTLRLTWDGIAIHGSPVINGYASHGCIGVPDEFAERLFAAARRGDVVMITRGKIIGVGDSFS